MPFIKNTKFWRDTLETRHRNCGKASKVNYKLSLQLLYPFVQVFLHQFCKCCSSLGTTTVSFAILQPILKGQKKKNRRNSVEKSGCLRLLEMRQWLISFIEKVILINLQHEGSIKCLILFFLYIYSYITIHKAGLYINSGFKMEVMAQKAGRAEAAFRSGMLGNCFQRRPRLLSNDYIISSDVSRFPFCLTQSSFKICVPQPALPTVFLKLKEILLWKLMAKSTLSEGRFLKFLAHS